MTQLCVAVLVSCSCRLWWLFAIQANLSEIREQRQRGSWEFALHRARDAQTYTSLYFRRLKGVPLSPEEEVGAHFLFISVPSSQGPKRRCLFSAT